MAGAKTIAADISQKMLSVAVKRARGRQLEEHLVFARMNAFRLSIADHSMDAVVELAMLHQTDNPACVVNEILRVLKPDGILVRYGCEGLPITKEQKEINRKCNEALGDIQRFYQDMLNKSGYEGLPFESWAAADECIRRCFEPPEAIRTDFTQVWTGKMKYGIHKLKTRASGGAQLIPDEIHNASWQSTDAYAMEKYGEDYVNMPGYSKFTGPLEIYKIKK